MPNLIPNFIKKIEFESNFKVVELEFELEPCDIGYHDPFILNFVEKFILHPYVRLLSSICFHIQPCSKG